MLFLSFLTSWSPLASSRPIYLFVGPMIHYSCRLGLMDFCYLFCQFFVALIIGLSFCLLGLPQMALNSIKVQILLTTYFSIFFKKTIFFFNFNWLKCFWKEKTKTVTKYNLQFPLNLRIWINTYYKGNPHSYRKGVKGDSDIPNIWFPSVICNQTWESLNIPRLPKNITLYQMPH